MKYLYYVSIVCAVYLAILGFMGELKPFAQGIGWVEGLILNIIFLMAAEK